MIDTLFYAPNVILVIRTTASWVAIIKNITPDQRQYLVILWQCGMLCQLASDRNLGVMLNGSLVDILTGQHTTQWYDPILDVVFGPGNRIHGQVVWQLVAILDKVVQHLRAPTNRFGKVIWRTNRHQAFEPDLPLVKVMLQEVGID